MNYSLVIFDCDGVLIDSEPLSAEVEAGLLNELGVDITPAEVVRTLVGRALPEIVEILKTRFGVAYGPGQRQLVADRLRAAFIDRLQPISGVRELINGLTVPCGVASNSGPDHLALGLGLTQLFGLLYPYIFSRTLVANGKPAPDIYLHAARVMNTAPHDVVVIEDSVTGVLAAKAAQMQVIGFGGGGHQQPDFADRLREAGADHIAHTMRDVAALLGVSGVP